MQVAVLFLASVICVVLGVLLFFKRKFRYWKDRGANFAQPRFPGGNLPLSPTSLHEVFEKIYSFKDNSPFVGAYIFAKPIVVPTNLEFIQRILVKDFNDFHERGFYTNVVDDPLSANLFSTDGDTWKSLRTRLSPTFTSGKMKFMFSTIVDVAEQMKEALFDEVRQGSTVEIKDLLCRFTTDVIGTCAFGIECNTIKSKNADFRYYGRMAIDESPLNVFMQLFVLGYPDLSRKLHIRVTKKSVAKFFTDTVRETIDYRKKNNVKRNDFMELLIQMKDDQAIDIDREAPGHLSFDEIAANAFLFFFAGFESSATAMLYSVYELALNPLIQDKVRKEINEVLDRHNGEFTYEALQDMVYLDQVLNETLRKYPTFAILIRKSGRDYRVPNSDVTIEKGTEIFVPVHAIQHDPEIYPNPDVFDPDRFAPEQVKTRHPMSFLTFGNGPRNCIGMRFGKLDARVGLVTLLRNFRFKATEKTEIPIEFDKKKIFMTPRNNVYLRVEKL